MNHSTIRHIKSQAKHLKKTNQTLTYCQCLNIIAQEKYGVRHFHELRTTSQKNESPLLKSNATKCLALPNEFRANDWPYFDLPVLSNK